MEMYQSKILEFLIAVSEIQNKLDSFSLTVTNAELRTKIAEKFANKSLQELHEIVLQMQNH